jgi:hypothetical protein
MRTTTSDWRLFSAAHPPEVASYLRANGWNEGRSIPNKLSIWTRKTEAGEFEILLPLTSVRDFTSRIAEVFRTLELAEGRPQLEIIGDIVAQRADIVRIASDTDAEDGSILLKSGVDLLDAITDMMSAAACAAVQRAAVLPNKKPPQVLRYMKALRLGQTEKGSYVFQVMSGLEQGAAADQNTSDLTGTERFERRVTITLARAVTALETLTHTLDGEHVEQGLDRAIEAGGSADLCDALSRMANTSSAALTMRFSWSPMLGKIESLPTRIVLEAGAAKGLKSTKRFLKQMATARPQRTSERLIEVPGSAGEFELRGFVESLSKLPQAAHGNVVVLGHVDQTLKRVNLELSIRDYFQALRAHGDSLAVACTGRLVMEGPDLFLRDVREFRVLRR